MLSPKKACRIATIAKTHADKEITADAPATAWYAQKHFQHAPPCRCLPMLHGTKSGIKDTVTVHFRAFRSSFVSLFHHPFNSISTHSRDHRVCTMPMYSSTSASQPASNPASEVDGAAHSSRSRPTSSRRFFLTLSTIGQVEGWYLHSF